VNDAQEGEGEEIYPDGSKYIGEFKNGMKNGKGKLKYADGTYYEGSFQDNHFDGYGYSAMKISYFECVFLDREQEI
jgi:hypothetical protein